MKEEIDEKNQFTAIKLNDCAVQGIPKAGKKGNNIMKTD